MTGLERRRAYPRLGPAPDARMLGVSLPTAPAIAAAHLPARRGPAFPFPWPRS